MVVVKGMMMIASILRAELLDQETNYGHPVTELVRFTRHMPDMHVFLAGPLATFHIFFSFNADSSQTASGKSNPVSNFNIRTQWR